MEPTRLSNQPAPFQGWSVVLTPGASRSLASNAKTSTLQPRSGKTRTSPHRARFATLPGRESALESGPHRAAKLTSITARIGGMDTPESGTGSAPADGKAAPHPGAAYTQTTAKRKTPRTPRQPERLPQPSPAPGSLALAPGSRSARALLGGQYRDAGAAIELRRSTPAQKRSLVCLPKRAGRSRS